MSVSQMIGVRSVCVFNDYRERLIEAQTFGSQRRLGPPPSRLNPRRRGW